MCVESTSTTSMSNAGKVVPPNVFRKRDVGFGVSANHNGRQPPFPDLVAAERLENFRTGVGFKATIQQTRGSALAYPIWIIAPPNGTFAARFVQAYGSADDSKAVIGGELASRSICIGAVPHDSTTFILVETLMNKASNERSRL